MEYYPSDEIRLSLNGVINSGLCTSCGICTALDESGKSFMLHTDMGPRPHLSRYSLFRKDPRDYCPGIAIDYASLYRKHYGSLPENWLMGHYEELYIGYSLDATTRSRASSGGILSQVLMHLLDSKEVDALILAKQGIGKAHYAGPVIVTRKDDVLDCAQSIYTPVATLSILSELDPHQRYAITLLPDAAAVLRKLQQDGDPRALAIRYVLGPYTGTQIYPMALKYFFKELGIKDLNELDYIKWRAGEWPGYLEMKAKNGKLIRSKKIYYNFLIPFYITQSCRMSIDFANEFCDLSVGDAWSPAYEARGQGFSVLASRSSKMQELLHDMQKAGSIHLESINWDEAGKMHGHMMDFKKRGAFIRMKWRRMLGKAIPRYGIEPDSMPWSRMAVEAVNISLFALAGTTVARSILLWLPEQSMGKLFDFLRLKWKAMSKPAKRKGLGAMKMRITDHA